MVRIFVTTMVRLAQSGAHPAVVNDQVGRLTFSTDIAQATAHLLAGEHPYGVYGFSNSGQPQSWAQIARRVFEIVQVDPNHVTECSTEEYTARVPPRLLRHRPHRRRRPQQQYRRRCWRCGEKFVPVIGENRSDRVYSTAVGDSTGRICEESRGA